MVNHKHVKCKDLLGSLSDYIDGDLEDQVCNEIERHMKECENCRVVVDTLRKTVEVYHQTAEGSALPPEIRERLFFKLDLQDLINKGP